MDPKINIFSRLVFLWAAALRRAPLLSEWITIIHSGLVSILVIHSGLVSAEL